MTNDDTPTNDRVSGWKPVPLNAEGRENARKLGRFLKSKGINKIISSDTKRALQTAEIVGEILGVKVIKTPGLRSWHMGSLEGMFHKVANPFLSFFQENPDIAPPQGEKFWAFYRRFRACINSIFKFAKAFPDARILVLTHSQDLDILKWIKDGIEPGEKLQFGDGIEPGGCLAVNAESINDFTVRKVL
jgi:broad specificity phosphatase PhoE